MFEKSHAGAVRRVLGFYWIVIFDLWLSPSFAGFFRVPDWRCDSLKK
jgi:hypothetical protein